MFNFIRKYQAVFQNSCKILCFHQHYMRFVCSAFLSTLSTVSLLHCSPSGGAWWYLTVKLIRISLMTGDVEHFPMCFFLFKWLSRVLTLVFPQKIVFIRSLVFFSYLICRNSFFLFNLSLTEGKVLYNIVLTSAIHQHESVIGMHVSPPSLTSFPDPLPPLPTPLGCYRAPVWIPWVMQ